MTVAFLQLLKSASARRGLDYDAGQVSTAEAGAVAEALNECAAICYDFYPWPATLANVHKAANGELVSGVYYPWDTLLNAYLEEPLAARAAGRRPRQVEAVQTGDDNYELVANRMLLVGGLAAEVELWMVFQKAAPRYTATAWSAVTDYDEADVVYHGGECWRSIQTPNLNHAPGAGGSSDYWIRMRLPDMLEQAVLAGVQRWFATTDGAPVSAQALRAAMEDRLQEKLRKIIEVQGQYSGGGPAHR